MPGRKEPGKRHPVFPAKIKILSACKPDSVSQRIGMVIIYLAPALLQGSCCLPLIIERAALRRSYTWHYSTQGLPAKCITAKSRELLPHVFTLIPPQQKDGNFLWHFLPALRRNRPLTGVLLFAVRTFLTTAKAEER